MRDREFQRGTAPAVPLWWRNCIHVWELAQAASEVIAHRAARMAMAGAAPGARDRREFARMGREKVEAFGQSASAMARPLYTLGRELAGLGLRQWGAWAPLASLKVGASPAQVADAQCALIRGLASAAGDQRLADAASSLVQKGLAPVHRAATRNAKRLRKANRHRGVKKR